MAEEGGTTFEYTPTWVVAVVCCVIVIVSLAVERTLHYLGKLLKKKHKNSLRKALLKIKEELMLLGFISLLLTVFQTRINKICISEELANKWLPCKKESTSGTAHFQAFIGLISGTTGGRLLAESSESSSSGGCPKGKVPILSTTALHHLHIFIFVLACVHVVFCTLTILLGSAKIRRWKPWEDAVAREYDPEKAKFSKIYYVQENDFIKKHWGIGTSSLFLGVGKKYYFLGWVHSFFKQFYGSVTRSEYTTLRWGFIMTHCRGNPKFNFHKYIMRALEADFKKVVGINWYLWLFIVVFLSLNVAGWHTYFWISFIPFMLLMAVGTKLEHVITQLAQKFVEKHVVVIGDLEVEPSDDHFWFKSPKLVLILIHIILVQNSFELAYLFWILVQYGFDSCIMDKVSYIIPRLVIGALVQFVCSYSTLPLYAIVTQMGSSFKKAIFDEHIQEGLVGWARQAKKKTVLKKAANGSRLVQMAKKGVKESSHEEHNSEGGEIVQESSHAEHNSEGGGEIVQEYSHEGHSHEGHDSEGGGEIVQEYSHEGHDSEGGGEIVQENVSDAPN